MNSKGSARVKIKYRIRKKISGSASKPRLSVFRSNSDIYAQLIDDNNGATLASASSRAKDIKAQKAPKTEKSKLVGAAIAQKAGELGIKTVVFDRNGYIYHGRVKAVAEGAREGGLEF
jgi:large subunit ribosomal protein L18